MLLESEVYQDEVNQENEYLFIKRRGREGGENQKHLDNNEE